MNRIRIPWARPMFWGQEKEFLMDALHSTWISDGPYVRRFEKDFSRCHGGRHCMTTSNGTAALHLALLGLGVGPGHEVIVPGFAFMAAANMVIAMGAKPVYADIDPDTWCMDAHDVAQKISSRTRAIVAVHTYGNMCDMTALKRLSRRHGICLVEDAAEAAFSCYKKRLAGTWGDVACFSFQATKTLAMGEGGCVMTSRKEWHEKMRLIRDHGMPRKPHYWHAVPGYNFRLTNIQAALGCAQLKHIKKIIQARHKVYAAYARHLSAEPGIKSQLFKPGMEAVVWSAAVELDPAVFRMGRDDVMRRLAMAGIETRPGFYPPSVMPLYGAFSLPVAEHVASRVICLPSFPGLSMDQVRYICTRLKSLRGRRT